MRLHGPLAGPRPQGGEDLLQGRWTRFGQHFQQLPLQRIEVHADALMTLAEVLRRAGRAAEAEPALQEALRLCERKGSTVLAERARAALSAAR